MSQRRISAIMPVYNGARFLYETLSALRKLLDKGGLLEVIVVDDGSTDRSIDIANSIATTVVSTPSRQGPGGARNYGAQIAKGDILWFIDADVIVPENSAGIILQSFDVYGVSAVFGSYNNRPAATNFLSQYKNLAHHYYHQGAHSDASTFWSGCGAVLKKEFLSVGGFDSGQFISPSIEDIELGYRLIEAGHKIRLVKDLQCTHLKSWQWRELLFTDIFHRALPWSRLIIQKGHFINDLNFSTVERFRAIVACVFFAVFTATAMTLLNWRIFVTVLLATLIANRQLVTLFYRKNGLIFSLGGFLFHQFYYLYSAFVFAWVLVENRLLKKVSKSSTNRV